MNEPSDAGRVLPLERMPLLLTRIELQELTGRKLRLGVCRWLRERGWVHEISANGWPVVSFAYAQTRLGGVPAPVSGRPNLEAVRALQRHAA